MRFTSRPLPEPEEQGFESISTPAVFFQAALEQDDEGGLAARWRPQQQQQAPPDPVEEPHAQQQDAQRGQRHRASGGLTIAGGKGINVARALKLLDVPVVELLEVQLVNAIAPNVVD